MQLLELSLVHRLVLRLMLSCDAFHAITSLPTPCVKDPTECFWRTTRHLDSTITRAAFVAPAKVDVLLAGARIVRRQMAAEDVIVVIWGKEVKAV